MNRTIIAALLAAAWGGSAWASETLAGPYAADILRVIDGDTVEARVRVWLGHDVTTLVRIRGIDAPELNGEPEAARAARQGLAALLRPGRVWLCDIGHDKYGGRIDAVIRLPSGEDAARAMRAAGLVRPLPGRRTVCPETVP